MKANKQIKEENKKKSPCLGNREVTYSHGHCVMYRTKSTGEITAKKHLSSEQHVQHKTSQSTWNSLDLIYTDVCEQGGHVCVRPFTKQDIHCKLLTKKKPKGRRKSVC